ncbi:hypothetical protein GCM10027341_00550 [Spirosoma knui]
MFNTIKTSLANKAQVSDLTRKLSLGPENVIARLAFAFSIASGKRMNVEDIQDSKGKEYSKNVLFGSSSPFYIALICQHYELYKTDKDIPKYIKMHIDDGLELIAAEMRENPNATGMEFLVNKIEEGFGSVE